MCSYWLPISSILQELLQLRFLSFVQNYHFCRCSRIWHFQLEDMVTSRFFLHYPLNFTISSEFFDIYTSYQLPLTISKLSHTGTDRDLKSFNREKIRVRRGQKKNEYL